MSPHTVIYGVLTYISPATMSYTMYHCIKRPIAYLILGSEMYVSTLYITVLGDLLHTSLQSVRCTL